MHARWKAACGAYEKRSISRSLLNGSGRTLGEGVEELFTYRADGTCALSSLAEHVHMAVFREAAKLGKYGTLQELSWPVWIRRKLAWIWESMASNHDECNGILRKVMWANTDVLRHVIGLEVKRSTLKETSECEHCRLFPKGDFLSGISSKRGKKNDNARNLMIGWMCGACAHGCGPASG